MPNTIQSSATITGAAGVLLTGVVLLLTTLFTAPEPDPLDTRLLVSTARKAIDSQRWEHFDELAKWIIDKRVGGVHAIRCVSTRDSLPQQVVSLPHDFDWSSAKERRSEGLGDSMVLELVAESQAASLGPLITGLFSSILVVLLMLLWLRKRLVIPFRELRAMLPQIDSRMDLDAKLNGAHAELTGLASDLRRMSSSLAEKARTSQANFLALELAFEQLHAVLNSLGEGVVVSDPGGELVMANPIAREILQIDRNRGDVSTIREMFPPDEQERMGNAMRRASHNLQTILIEDLVIGNRTYNLSVAPIRDSFQRSDESNAGRQKDRGVAIVFLDMTEFHELNRMKDDFLSSVSHELRTPLTSIRSFSEILLHMTPDDKETWTEFLEIVNQEAERLTRLVNDVLDLSRIEAGRMEFILEPVEAKPQLSQCVAVFTQMVSAKDAEIELVCEDELPEVEADKDRLHQVMTNLIGNACKFLPEKGGKVRVSAERAGRYVLFRVEDSGQGVPFDHWDLVFEKFKQVGDTLTEKPQGTGLGLPICRKILTSMKGRIWCDASSDLGGAQFSFTLPICDRESAVW